MIDNGPALWGHLLSIVNVPGAVVSGGCIRDYMLGLQPHDIDIFVPRHTVSELGNLASGIQGRQAAYSATHLALQPGYGSYSTQDDPLVGVVEGTIDCIPVNILCNERHSTSNMLLIEGHDFGITQACWGPAHQFETTAAFDQDLADKTATLLTLRSYERSLRRFDKFTARNGPVLTLVDPFQYKLEFNECPSSTMTLMTLLPATATSRALPL